jgi:hypothetical protein
LNFFLKETKSALIIVGIDLGGDKRKKRKKVNLRMEIYKIKEHKKY